MFNDNVRCGEFFGHVCCVFRPENACVRMVEKDEKHCKIMRKVPFPSCAREPHVRRIVFDLGNACASKRLLVEIHNTCSIVNIHRCKNFWSCSNQNLVILIRSSELASK